MFSCSIQKNETTGNCELKIDKELPKELILKTYEEMASIPLDNAISGWHNSYTCI